jgi:hypothetical protein
MTQPEHRATNANAVEPRAITAQPNMALVSDFAIPSGGAQAFAARWLVRALYFAFWALTGLDVKQLPDYQNALACAGFACARVETGLGGALRSELWLR